MSTALSIINIAASGAIALLLALNMYRASYQTRIEMAAYMAMIVVSAAITLKLFFNYLKGIDIVFDPYGMWFRVGVLCWLLANQYAMYRDGVAVLWSLKPKKSAAHTFVAKVSDVGPAQSVSKSMCDDTNDI